MPELPEVEVTRRGLLDLVGEVASSVVTRRAGLRYPFPAGLSSLVVGRRLADIARRGKYLLLDFGNGQLLIHLGMSGSLRLTAASDPPEKHDHLEIGFGATLLRFRDPRRFGAALWLEGDPAAHPLLANLGLEPLARNFSATTLAAVLKDCRMAIKPALMDAGRVVGVGNIYASESLFLAGIDPRRTAGRISRVRLDRLASAIKKTLRSAIRAGGSSLRDFVHSDGSPGDFQTRHRVYGRAGEPCYACRTPIRCLRQGGRATYYCPRCQT